MGKLPVNPPGIQQYGRAKKSPYKGRKSEHQRKGSQFQEHCAELKHEYILVYAEKRCSKGHSRNDKNRGNDEADDEGIKKSAVYVLNGFSSFTGIQMKIVQIKESSQKEVKKYADNRKNPAGENKSRYKGIGIPF